MTVPRPGGEADKLGNRYESLWSVKLLLKLLDGEYVDVTVERIGEESSGIDLIATTNSGSREFYSVKRQHHLGNWTLHKLAQKDNKSGRSILSDLVRKAGDRARGIFVSGTSAFELEELVRMAATSNCFENFCQRLTSSGRHSGNFEKHLVRLCGSRESAFSALNQMEIVITLIHHKSSVGPDLK